MILAVLQARVSSSRLPGKVLKPILGKPMIIHEIERLQQCENIDKLILATSMEESDNELVDVCKAHGVEVYRGNLEDVLDRYYQCSMLYNPEHVVRVTGDCPVIDPNLVDAVIDRHKKTNSDYTSNVLNPTFPDGLDVEVIKMSVLKEMWEKAQLKSEREHVTLYIRNNINAFNICSYVNEVDLSSMRWTVDEVADFKLIDSIFSGLYRKKKFFDMNDILAFLQEHEELIKINSGIQRNEGLKKSMLEDYSFSERQV